MSSRAPMRACPACAYKVMASEWACPACAYVLDTAFLGGHITNDPPPSPYPASDPDQPAITFLVGGPTPPPAPFRRRRAHVPASTVLQGGVPATFVQQHMRFTAADRLLEGPLKEFLLEQWSAFIRGRPALIALPSPINTALDDRPARSDRALATQTTGLLGTAMVFRRRRLPGAIIGTGDGRVGFAQPLPAGIRLRELLSASRAEGNDIAEAVAVAAVLAVERARRAWDGGTNPVGSPIDVTIGFDGTIGLARMVSAMCIDSPVNQYSSEQLLPWGGKALKNLLGDGRLRPALEEVVGLEGDAFIDGLAAIVADDPEGHRASIAAVARGVFPDRYEMSQRAFAGCEDQLLEPIEFPPLEVLHVEHRPLQTGGTITTAPVTLPPHGEGLTRFLGRAGRRLPTKAELQAAIAGGLVTVTNGGCHVCNDVGQPAIVYATNGVLGPTPPLGSRVSADRSWLIHDPVPWPE